MIIAVSSESDQGLESVVGAHFGRCPFFVLAEVDGTEIKAVRSVQNPFFAAHQPGQVPGFIHELGADVMLTGGMGQRAIMFFQQYGIQAATGAYGTVRHALQMFFQAELSEAEPCAESTEHAAHGHHHHHDHDHEHEHGYEQDDLGRLAEEADALKSQLDDLDQQLKDLG